MFPVPRTGPGWRVATFSKCGRRWGGRQAGFVFIQSEKEEWGYSTRRHMLEPVRPEAVLPGRDFKLPTLSHFLIVNKTVFFLA